MVLDVSYLSGSATTTSFHVFDLSSVDGAEDSCPSTLTPMEIPKHSAHSVKCVIGRNPRTGYLLFVNSESWVCGMIHKKGEPPILARHFYVQNEYQGDEGDELVLPVRSCDDDVVFSRYGELVVIENGVKVKGSKAIPARTGRSS
jgi:hypothetical protein